MERELDNIRAYLEEGRRLWDTNPELVISRRFYVLWEEAHRPAPFRIETDTLPFGPFVLDMPEGANRIGRLTWDSSEECAALVVETDAVEQHFLLLFRDGFASVEERPPVPVRSEDVGLGERLELFYDIIAHVRQALPGTDPAALRPAQFRDALKAVCGNHSPAAGATVRRMSAPFRDRLIRRALEDLPADDIGRQLALPLEGTYAHPEKTRIAALSEHAPRIPPRTRREVLADAAYLETACRLARDSEAAFVLPLRGLEILASPAPDTVVIRIPCPAIADLSEGDVLRLVTADEGKPVGDLRIDMPDRDRLYGRAVFADGEPPPARVLEELVGRPRQTPRDFLWRCLEALRRDTEDGIESGPGAALSAALGLIPCSLGEDPAAAGEPPPGLDPYQARAWLRAVTEANPLVVTQGPPGTGKTAVLEAVLRSFAGRGQRILLTAPSNTAVDNACRRVADLPVLRVGHSRDAVADDVANLLWADPENLRTFRDRARRSGSCILAGTHIGILRSEQVREEVRRQDLFDVIVFDEAGMTRVEEFLPCLRLARRAVLFGDHRQLPPHPLPQEVLAALDREAGPAPRSRRNLVEAGALEWLAEHRGFPLTLLQRSYRCQNPFLLRFASTLFYDAAVRPSPTAEYLTLSYPERRRRYPTSGLRLLRTDRLPPTVRGEHLVVDGGRPGLENGVEAELCAALVYEALERYPLLEITVISPYRRQIRLIRRRLDRQTALRHAARPFDEAAWELFLQTRVSTVDSFQGGESDMVILSYVRSNPEGRIGFVNDPNRVNVAHTRCRRGMAVVGDIRCLRHGDQSGIFTRLENSCRRDGQVVTVTPDLLTRVRAGEIRVLSPPDNASS